ncbi:MAG: hypothetical protein ACJA08_002139 [Cyclobacteriaceae bacterium]|jgi:hypothetical protein
MKKKVIIGIHGLGNKPANRVLTSWWKKSMLEGLERIGLDLDLPKFEMIYWADVFNERPAKLRKALPDDPLLFHEPYTKAPLNYVKDDISIRKNVIDFLGRQMNEVFLDEDLNLNFPYLSDYVLEHYFQELSAYYHEVCYDRDKIECMAKDLIRSKAVKTLRKYRDYDIYLVSHSMGSIIAFDVLTFLVPDIKIHTFATIGSPLGLPIVISKIASEYKINGAGKAIMKTPPGIAKHWYNFSDLHDTIAFNYMLSDDFDANELGVIPMDFLVVNDYTIKGIKNQHKSFGYMRTHQFAHTLADFIEG